MCGKRGCAGRRRCAAVSPARSLAREFRRALCRVAGRRGVAYMLAMLMKRPSLIAAAAALLASSALAQPDAAADYPNHLVRIIVSTSAGGGVDTVTRIIAAQLQDKLGQSFIVENRG